MRASAFNNHASCLEAFKEMLVHIKAKASGLGSLATDLLLDHVIYMKALEVLYNWKNAERLNQPSNGWFPRL